MKLVPRAGVDGERPRVVIVGAGFGGLTAAKRLAKTPVNVTLIDRENHHLFQPLLPIRVVASLILLSDHGGTGGRNSTSNLERVPAPIARRLPDLFEPRYIGGETIAPQPSARRAVPKLMYSALNASAVSE